MWIHRARISKGWGAPFLPTSPASRPRPHPSPGEGALQPHPQMYLMWFPVRREWPDCPKRQPVGAMKTYAQSE
jgi:hypothetical protein